MTALSIAGLKHQYGDRTSLQGVSFTVDAGDLFALLGPNGGGKTTLFRIVSTLIKPTSGTVEVFGVDAIHRAADARQMMGVVFQAPAVDPWLTVLENLRHHGYLYGLSGARLSRAMERALERFGLTPRAHDRAAILSGGLRRRLELAKALLPEPRLLILDEPSTGLDPSVRRDMIRELVRLRDDAGTTVVLTTHLMEEAAACDRVGILHEGRLVAIGSPADLVDTIGGEVITVTTPDAPDALAAAIRERFDLPATVAGNTVRMERKRAHEFVATLVEAFPGQVSTVAVGRPTLDDVFFHYTGTSIADVQAAD
jgi:ABC-2 type transport system ATP-binding protein